MSLFRGIGFFIIAATEVYAIMKDTESNEVKEKECANVAAIEKAIAELPAMTRQGKIGIVNIQRALKCGFPAAAKIYDLIKTESRIKIEKNIFELDAKMQMFYLEQLVNDALLYSGHASCEVHERLHAELKVIEDLGMAADFLFAGSVAGILRELSGNPCFVGIGCCSLVAYKIGITGEKLDPLEHGLIFERGFGEGRKPEMPFSFCVPEEILPEFMGRMNKIYGEALLCKHDGGLVLSVGDTSVTVLDSIEPHKYSYRLIEESIDISGAAVFQEDYMRIMRYAAGYEYTEADRIRRIIGKRKVNEITDCRRDFMRRAMRHLSFYESKRMFSEFELKMQHAFCKAYALSVKTVLNAYPGFTGREA